MEFIFAIVLSIFYIISYKFFGKYCSEDKITSLSAGMLVFLIFSELIPHIFASGVDSNSYSSLSSFLVFGFLSYHVLDFYIHENIRKKRKKILNKIHSIGFFLDNFVKGFILTIILSVSKNIFLAFIPFIVSAITSGASFFQCNKSRLSIYLVILIASFYIFGGVSAFILAGTYLSSSLSFVTGAFIYFALRDEFPKENHEKIIYFIFGVLTMFILTVIGS